MKIALGILLCLFFAVVSPSARAQTRLTVSQALDFWITNAEKEIVPAADAMPEGKYSFAPTAGEFTGVRTFAQQVKHVAASNHGLAAYIRGEQPTPEEKSETGPDAVRSKAQIMEYLRASFTALHKAVATVTEANLTEPLTTHIEQKTRLQFAVDAVAHSYDHYGQMVEYLRMNGIVPPASRK